MYLGVFQNTYRKTELESCHFRHSPVAVIELLPTQF